MRILVTNDDGINAPGLKVLEAIAAKVAGPDGEVWVVAPAFEQSGVGHCISYSRPMMVAPVGKSGPSMLASSSSSVQPAMKTRVTSGIHGRRARDRACSICEDTPVRWIRRCTVAGPLTGAWDRNPLDG